MVAGDLSVAVSAVILNKAVRDRIQRNEQDELLRQMHEKPEETKKIGWKSSADHQTNSQ